MWVTSMVTDGSGIHKWVKGSLVPSPSPSFTLLCSRVGEPGNEGRSRGGQLFTSGVRGVVSYSQVDLL